MEKIEEQGIREQASEAWKSFSSADVSKWKDRKITTEEQFVEHIVALFDRFQKLPVEKRMQAMESFNKKLKQLTKVSEAKTTPH